MNRKTSWGKVAEWYDDLLEKDPDSYQRQVILPNLLRLLDVHKGDTIVDLACGQGFFTRAFFQPGVRVIGIDLAAELIALAKKNSPKEIQYIVSSADQVLDIKNNSVDKVTIVLALQNIENINGVLQECRRILKPHGALLLVLNHSAFRVLKESSWGWDEQQKIQYRRIDRYLSESKVKIQMHPSTSSGRDPGEYTISFHRPLQFYFKALHKQGFAVTRLEEWGSHRKSESGPRAAAEDRARKEIPLFLFLEAVSV